MCVRSNNKSRAHDDFSILEHNYVRFAVEKKYLSPGTGLLLSSRKESRELLRTDCSSSVTTTASNEKLFLIGAKLGAKESGHPAACNQCSKQRRAHVFARDRGQFLQLLDGDANWGIAL